jgi:predicted RNA-binding protein with PUA-like domain
MSPRRPERWLVKSEPESFSFDDLLRAPRRTTGWDGVRNYQARNFLRDGLRKGDQVLFYHSNAKPPAVVGLCEVTREAYPDPSQFDPASAYFDPASKADDPRWLMVDLRAIQAFVEPVGLSALRANPHLAGLPLLQRGQRLSVMPIAGAHFREILRMGGLVGA